MSQRLLKYRWPALILMLATLYGLVAGRALAHAELVSSVPEANAVLATSPAQVELFFNESLEPSFSTVTVLDSSGTPVTAADSQVDSTDSKHMVVSLRSLPDGVYTVSWKTLSVVDGHITAGVFPFAVGNVEAAELDAAQQAARKVAVPPGDVVTRWLLYLAAAGLVGGLLFILLVWQPALEAVETETGRRLAGQPPWPRLARLLLGGLILAQALGLLFQAGQATGGVIAAPWSSAIGQLLFDTRNGAFWLARLVMALLLVSLWPARPTVQRWLGLIPAALLLLTISFTGHGAAEARPAWPILADWLHLLSVSAWIGGLIFFITGLVSVRGAEVPLWTRLIARLIPRFSALALVSVSVLVLSGLYAAILHIGTLEKLIGSWYGRALILKLLLALPLLGLGAVNLLHTRPAAARAAGRLRGDAALVTRFQWLVAAEAGLAAAVLLGAALLMTLPPALIKASSAALNGSADVDDLSLTLEVNPGHVGVNTFSVKVTANGQPLADAKEVALRFSLTSANMPPSQVQLIGQGKGLYTNKGAYFSLPGAWQVQAVVRRQDHFDAFANFNFDLGGAGVESTYPWYRVSGFLLYALAIAYPLAFIKALGRTPAKRIALGLLPTLALIVMGFLVIYRPPARAGPTDPVNPIPPNADSVSAGQALYEQNCLPCHGESGKGDGPVGVTLSPRPADLTVHTALGVHTDGQLFEWISNGFPDSAMPAFKSALTEEQRWHVVNYIRTLAAP